MSETGTSGQSLFFFKINHLHFTAECENIAKKCNAVIVTRDSERVYCVKLHRYTFNQMRYIIDVSATSSGRRRRLIDVRDERNDKSMTKSWFISSWKLLDKHQTTNSPSIGGTQRPCVSAGICGCLCMSLCICKYGWVRVLVMCFEGFYRAMTPPI